MHHLRICQVRTRARRLSKHNDVSLPFVAYDEEIQTSVGQDELALRKLGAKLLSEGGKPGLSLPVSSVDGIKVLKNA